jgi:hypothetical protein
MRIGNSLSYVVVGGSLLLVGGLGGEASARGGRQVSRQVGNWLQNNGNQNQFPRGDVSRQQFNSTQGQGNPYWRQPANSVANRNNAPANQYVPYGNNYNRQPYYGPQPAYQPQAINQANYNYANSAARPATGIVPSNYVVPTPVAKAVPPAPVKVPTAARPLTVRESAAALLLAQTREAAWDAYENYTHSDGYADTYRELHKFLQSVKSLSDEAGRQSSSGTVSESFANALRDAEINLQVLQVQTESWQRTAAKDRPELPAQLQKMAASLAELMTASNVASQLYAAVDEEPATVIRAKQ